MEKQSSINRHSIVLNHLPRILNIMQILNMIVYGIVVSQPVFFISAMSSLQKTVSLSPMTEAFKKLVKKAGARLYKRSIDCVR